MSTKVRLGVVVALGGFILCAAAGTAWGQVDPQDRMMSLIPPKAIFFLQRRGYAAIEQVFLKSNLGQMAQDDAINQFVHGSRVRIGEMIVKACFDLETPEDVAAQQKLLHSALKPFWFDPTIMYVMLDEKELGKTPGFGFICMPSAKRRAECRDGLDALIKAAMAKKAGDGGPHEFTHKTGIIQWRVLAGGEKLPADPKDRADWLKDRSMLMVSWSVPPLLLVATNSPAAEAMENALANPAAAKQDAASVKAVMAKTALKDWAFRWHFDAEAMTKMLMGKRENEEAQETATIARALGLDKIRGVGGTSGYADDVYTHLTYVDAPDVALMKVLKQGGSYKQALKMVPSESSIFLAAQLDTGALLKMVRRCVVEAQRASTTAPAEPQEKGVEKVLEQLERLAKASDGNVGVFMTDLGQLAMGMMGGGPPVGAVLGLKDREEAIKAVDELMKLAGLQEDQDEPQTQPAGPADPPGPPGPVMPGAFGPQPTAPRPKEYRKHKIRYAGDDGPGLVRFVVMKDRIVVGMSDASLKTAIDAALDDTGGFEPDSKGQHLAKLAGDGSGVFVLDLAAMAKLGWPLLMQMAEGMPEDFPFVALPSPNKMVRMLGPEIVVLQPDDGGILLKGRGMIPFSTKTLLYPMMMYVMMGAF